ncbi:hypothetical protein C0992_004540 [Termitomyces sp. T32_za158]|nr:hypothetical protein C0992_004540 [Termitomyces sp. T32_za158]
MAFGNSTNFRWYQCSGLSPTNHTVKITHSGGDQNATLNFDYFTYTPSFSSLAEREGLQPSQPSPSDQPSRPSLGILLGAIIGPILLVIMIAILVFMYKKKLVFWSSGSNNTGMLIAHLLMPDNQTVINEGISQSQCQTEGTPGLPAYTEHHAVPPPPSNGFMQAFVARLWQRPQPSTVEAFPPDYTPSESHQSLVQRKPILPVWNSNVDQRRASHQTYAGSIDETTADLRFGRLEQMILALQQEVEGTRRNRGRNEAHMRQTVGNGRGNEYHDHDSMMSTIVA